MKLLMDLFNADRSYSALWKIHGKIPGITNALTHRRRNTWGGRIISKICWIVCISYLQTNRPNESFKKFHFMLSEFLQQDQQKVFNLKVLFRRGLFLWWQYRWKALQNIQKYCQTKKPLQYLDLITKVRSAYNHRIDDKICNYAIISGGSDSWN